MKMRNLIEPDVYLDLFLRYPPVGFAVESAADGLPVFDTDFDVLTTFDDPKTARRIRRLPVLPRLFRFRTRFVGTTITEYAPLPAALSAKELIRSVLENHAKQALTVIKDVPVDSPFLAGEDNEFARALTREAEAQGFFALEGQALAYMRLDFGSVEEYLGRLSRNRRKDLRRKMKSRELLEVRVSELGDGMFRDEALVDEYYGMFKAVYDQSEIHFDLLTRDFFRALLTGKNGGGVVMQYYADGALAGYNICLVHEKMFIDKYVGFNYPAARDYNLYFVSWLYNLQYALDNGLQAYIAGWTDPDVKKSLGMSFTFTRHLVRIKNPMLRALAKPFKRVFESDKNVMEKQ